MERNIFWRTILIASLILYTGCQSSANIIDDKVELVQSDTSNTVNLVPGIVNVVGNNSNNPIVNTLTINRERIGVDINTEEDLSITEEYDQNPEESEETVVNNIHLPSDSAFRATVMSTITFNRDSTIRPMEVYAPFTYEMNPHIQRQLDLYSGTRINFVKRALSRGSVYIHEIKEIFREYNLPEELAYLPIIESGFSNYVVSNKGATGMWQFMPGTARWMGMKIDVWIDERRDPIIAARKAAQYLKFLYEKFGCWHLTLAAYNYGGFNVKRAITRAGGSTDYFDLVDKMVLPRETRDYVPRFIAMIEMIRHPEQYGIEDYVENGPQYTYMHIPFMASTGLAARQAGLTQREFAEHNPALQTVFIPAASYNYQVRLPVDNAERLMANMETLRSQSRSNYIVYYISPGDSLSIIAQRHGIPIGILMSINGIRNANRIWQGQRLYIPTNGGHVAQVHTQAPTASRPAATNNNYYRVRPGETLSHIAMRFGVTQQYLARINNIINPAYIRAGDVIRIR